MKNLTIVILFIIFYIAGLISGGTIVNIYKESSIRVDTVRSILYKDTCITVLLTRSNVLKEILSNDIQEPLIVLKQSILETGNYTSNVCEKYNNLFGFYNGKRYLRFKNWQESVTYYKSWQLKHYSGGSYHEFLTKIKYAEDMKDYINKLKGIKL